MLASTGLRSTADRSSRVSEIPMPMLNRKRKTALHLGGVKGAAWGG